MQKWVLERNKQVRFYDCLKSKKIYKFYLVNSGLNLQDSNPKYLR